MQPRGWLRGQAWRRCEQRAGPRASPAGAGSGWKRIWIAARAARAAHGPPQIGSDGARMRAKGRDEACSLCSDEEYCDGRTAHARLLIDILAEVESGRTGWRWIVRRSGCFGEHRRDGRSGWSRILRRGGCFGKQRRWDGWHGRWSGSGWRLVRRKHGERRRWMRRRGYGRPEGSALRSKSCHDRESLHGGHDHHREWIRDRSWLDRDYGCLLQPGTRRPLGGDECLR